MEFSGCDSYTVGAEWELQILDSESLDLSPGIESLIPGLSGNHYVKPEFIQSCVELNTPVCKDSSEIESHLTDLTRDVVKRCQKHDLDLAGAGTHPFCRRLALITPLPRYEELALEHGYIGQTQLAFATHVHVGLKSGDDAIRVMRYLTPCLPLLIAIGANSPFWRGHDTGYASYRRRLLAASRSYGLPPYFENWLQFSRFYDMARRAGSIKTVKDIHWDIRPHPDFGTLECRVIDAQSTVKDLTFIAGLVRLLVAWIGASSKAQIEATVPRRISSWIDRENHFRASHWGMQARLIHDNSGETRPVSDYLESLATVVMETAREIGEEGAANHLAKIACDTPGYVQQRRNFETNNDAKDVVRALRDSLYQELIGQNSDRQ
jgi:carboxylate-amine ligase